MKTVTRKKVLAFAVTALLAGISGVAAAQATFPDFVVNEGAVAGSLPINLTADKITGNYVERITFSGTATSGNFDASLKWEAGQFVGSDGTAPVESQLGGVSGDQYGLYALYQARGTYVGSADGTTTFTFAPSSVSSLSFFLDPNGDTTFAQPDTGTGAWTTDNSGDDYQIASGTPLTGEGTLDPSLSTCTGGGGAGINCGSFGASSTFSLNAAGQEYFTNPIPFYQLSFQSGQLNNFTPTGTQTINGSLDVVFAEVPEPASIALLGLGLTGLIMARRRNKKAEAR